ncbi:hypothetical protein BC937DRAFT_89793 [Endogone sp. FLAS-F59071]|nr:hypothetical protein BC937DRAFT_89793 [Endogone sp. FLAS-F59071]|eukprot:RUS17570.1 hypothetical protein BC937DRAFT_89793 [Endogone sp. FLAS-F59071]
MAGTKIHPLFLAEILFNIFSFLAIPNEAHFLNLLAVCAVCRAWQSAALPIIRRDLAELDLRSYTALDIFHLTKLLDEVRKIGALDLSGLLQSVTIGLDSFCTHEIASTQDRDEYLFDDFSSSAITLIQTLPKFPSLILNFPDSNGDEIFETGPFLAQLAAIHGASITRIQLDGLEQFTVDDASHPLADLLCSLPNLIVIRLRSIFVDTLVADALAHCPRVQSVQFVRTTHLHTTDIFSKWPELSRVNLSVGSFAVPALLSLKLCPKLTALRLVATRDASLISGLDEALMELLSHHCQTLTRLTLVNLLRRMHLEELLFTPLPNLVYFKASGDGRRIFTEVGGRDLQMPQLRVMDVTEITHIDEDFVVAVAKTCPRLREVRFSSRFGVKCVESGKYGKAWKELIAQGFERCEGADVWTREDLGEEKGAEGERLGQEVESLV